MMVFLSPRLLALGFGACYLTVVLPYAVPAFADNWCAPSRAPTIHIVPSTDRISYDFTQSEKQLNGFRVDTVNPYGNNVISDVGGLMRGGIETEQKMKFGTMTNRNTGEVCYWYDSVDVDIHIQPTIYVASDFPQGSCMHNAILEHEHKHVVVDREIVNKYANILGTTLQNEVYNARIYGPVPLSQEQAIASTMKTRLGNIMNEVNQQMSDERKRRQQEIDSLNEYQRVNAACK